VTGDRFTQTGLPSATTPTAKVSGCDWHYRQRSKAAQETTNPRFQDQLMEKLAEVTGISLFRS